MVYQLEDTQKAAPLFAGWQETMLWSCLQKVMGSIYVDSLEKPSSAMALLGDFCFLAGKPEQEIVMYGPGQQEREFLIMVPKDTRWAEQIKACYGEKAVQVERYAIKKEPDIFCENELQAIVHRLPDGYSLQMIDASLFARCREIQWCKDWVAQYADFACYEKYGLGAVILKDGEPVSGASSYSGYNGGIEIEIDTREDYRRQGLASICGAKLILECLARGWYPSWDAQNQGSVALAKKLGYHYDHAYTAYEVYATKA